MALSPFKPRIGHSGQDRMKTLHIKAAQSEGLRWCVRPAYALQTCSPHFRWIPQGPCMVPTALPLCRSFMSISASQLQVEKQRLLEAKLLAQGQPPINDQTQSPPCFPTAKRSDVKASARLCLFVTTLQQQRHYPPSSRAALGKPQLPPPRPSTLQWVTEPVWALTLQRGTESTAWSDWRVTGRDKRPSWPSVGCVTDISAVCISIGLGAWRGSGWGGLI